MRIGFNEAGARGAPDAARRSSDFALIEEASTRPGRGAPRMPPSAAATSRRMCRGFNEAGARGAPDASGPAICARPRMARFNEAGARGAPDAASLPTG